MKKNIVTLTDSYKMTHHNQYDTNTQNVYSYFEAREGAKYPTTTFFGLQYLIKNWLEGVVVTKENIDRAEKLAARHFGNSDIFKRERWDYIIENYGGKLPIRIKAVPEGMVVTVNNIMMSVENTDSKCFWLTNHLETLLCQVWAPSTVATQSRWVKEVFKDLLNKTCDQGAGFAGLAFMLHDFGMRGVSSMESAGIEGAGHLINFLGTDTVIAMEYIEEYYGDVETGYSVAATEHSVMTAKGREGEADVIEQLLNNHPTGILSVVSDSYDIYNCVDQYYGVKFKDKILARDGKFVVRPDSGDPVRVVCGDFVEEIKANDYKEFLAEAQEILDDIIRDETPHGECGGDISRTFKWDGKHYNVTYEPDWNRHDKQYYYIDNYGDDNTSAVEIEYTLEQKGLLEILWDRFGGTVNEKGYKVLNPKIGLIWGDGIDSVGIKNVCEAVVNKGFSVENMVFGMGGHLLQRIHRDTQRFAFKSSAQKRDGVWYDVFKDPIDGSKTSKKGILKLIKVDGEYKTVKIDNPEYINYEDEMITVFENGVLIKEYDFNEVITNSN